MTHEDALRIIELLEYIRTNAGWAVFFLVLIFLNQSSGRKDG